MKNLFAYIEEAMSVKALPGKRQIGGKWLRAEENGFVAVFLLFDKPSDEYGIDGGKISKLEIRDSNNHIVCNYDREWDIQPDEKVLKFYEEIIKKYN